MKIWAGYSLNNFHVQCSLFHYNFLIWSDIFRHSLVQFSSVVSSCNCRTEEGTSEDLLSILFYVFLSVHCIYLGCNTFYYDTIFDSFLYVLNALTEAKGTTVFGICVFIINSIPRSIFVYRRVSKPSIDMWICLAKHTTR